MVLMLSREEKAPSSILRMTLDCGASCRVWRLDSSRESLFVFSENLQEKVRESRHAGERGGKKSAYPVSSQLPVHVFWTEVREDYFIKIALNPNFN